MSGRLGELLVRENLISLQQLQKAQEEQKRTGGRIGSLLVRQGAIAETDLTSFLSKQYGVPAISLKDFDIDEEVLKLIRYSIKNEGRIGIELDLEESLPVAAIGEDEFKQVTTG